MNQADPPEDDSDEERVLINGIVRGDKNALAILYQRFWPRLWRLVNFRLHPKLHGRVDPDDVLQTAWMNAVNRIEYFLGEASQSCFIWFRMIVIQTLIDIHRQHLGAEKRDASREVPITGGWSSESTSSSLQYHLLGSVTSPSSAFRRAELAGQLDLALKGLDEIDREVLALRHFEELTNRETAKVLETSEQAASARYVRALRRLKQVLSVFPGFEDGENPGE